ncbi:MAG: NfeD family protein [Ignavibacteriales bacterium]|nr:NfeD family protein [Ignavibacteriales bacterium]
MFESFMSPVIVWAIVGIVLIIIELMSLTFVFAFFGVGALIVSLTTWAGITPGISSQLAVFAVSSLFMLFVLRKTAKKLFFGSHDIPPDYKGQKVKVVKAIPVGGEGAISYRGSVWIAFSESAEPILDGSTVEIVSLDGIRAKVKYIE